ncbi:MAG: alpha/beta hydrolase-fold protein [Planctomycetota bacterium]
MFRSRQKPPPAPAVPEEKPRPSLEPSTVRIHIHYPADEGEIRLRTNADWDLDIVSISVDETNSHWEFEVTTAEPFLYYKPLLLPKDAEVRWSDGPDRIATAGAERVWDAFPAFDPAPAEVTDPHEVEVDGHGYTLRAFLPRGYHENELHRYPVVYMMDGHNLFYRHEAATGQDWSVQDTVQKLHEMNTIEPVIVVGVYPNDRMVDYSDEGIDAFSSFMSEKLKPHIDEKFRTLPDPAHNAVVGSSLGGVAAFELAWRFPEQFGKVASLSASFGYADRLATQVLEDERREIQIYLDSGWPRDNFEVTRDMRARLVRAGYQEGVELMYFAFPDGRHNEQAWGDRVHLPFQFFFGLDTQRRTFAGEYIAEQRR